MQGGRLAVTQMAGEGWGQMPGVWGVLVPPPDLGEASNSRYRVRGGPFGVSGISNWDSGPLPNVPLSHYITSPHLPPHILDSMLDVRLTTVFWLLEACAFPISF